jgi:hypothetical protein
MGESRAKLCFYLGPKSKTECDGKSRLSSPNGGWVWATTTSSELADESAVGLAIRLLIYECASFGFDRR